MNVIGLKPGVHVSGAVSGQDVEVIAITPVGEAFNLVYRKLDGAYDSVLLFPDDLLKLEIHEGGGSPLI